MMHYRNTKFNLLELIVAVLILVFVYTGVSKLLDRHLFESRLLQMPLLHVMPVFVSYTLPFTELVVAVLLLLPGSRIWSLYASLLLLCMFTIYLLYMLLLVPNLPCSCGGVLQQMGWKTHLIFNGVLIGINVYAIRLQRKLLNMI